MAKDNTVDMGITSLSDADIGSLKPVSVEGSPLVESNAGVQGAFRLDAEDAFLRSVEEEENAKENKFAGEPTWTRRDQLEYSRLESVGRLWLEHPDEHDDNEFGAILDTLNQRRFGIPTRLMAALDRPGDTHGNQARLREFFGLTDQLNAVKTKEEQEAILESFFEKALPDYAELKKAKQGADGGAAWARKFLAREGRDFTDWAGDQIELLNPNNYIDTVERLAHGDTEGAAKAYNRDVVGQIEMSDAQAVHEAEKRLLGDRVLIDAAKVVPFIPKAYREIVNIAAKGADQRTLEGLLNVVDPKDRNTVRSLVQAVRPAHEDIPWIPDEGVLRIGRSINGTAQGFGRFAHMAGVYLGGLGYMTGDWYNPASWRLQHLAPGTRERLNQLREEFKEDIANYEALGMTKFGDASDFAEKAVNGFFESAPMQASTLAGALLRRGGAAMSKSGQKWGVVAEGAGWALQGYVAVSMIGEHFDNLVLNGVDMEYAVPLAFYGGVGDTLVENWNVDQWFGAKLSAQEARYVGWRGAVRMLRRHSANDLRMMFQANAKQAVIVTMSELCEEMVQGWNKQGVLSLAEGRNLIASYFNSEAGKAMVDSLVQALPTCTAFGLMSAVDFTGQARKGGIATYQDNLNDIAREVAKREGADTLDVEVRNRYVAQVKNTADQIARATSGMSARQRAEYLARAELNLTPAEQAFYADHCAFFDTLAAQDGALYATKVAGGSLNEALFAKEGWRFEHDADGNITRIVSPDGKIDEQMRVLNREATVEDLDDNDLFDLVNEWNDAVANDPDFAGEKPFAPVGKDTAKADVSAWSEEERARLEKMVTEQVPGFFNDKGITLFMLAKNADGSRRSEGALSHEVLHAFITRLEQTAGRAARKNLRGLITRFGDRYQEGAAKEAGGLGLGDAQRAIDNALPDKLDWGALGANFAEGVRRVLSLGFSRGDFKKVFTPNGTTGGVDPAAYYQRILGEGLLDLKAAHELQQAEKAEHKKLVEKILAERKAKRQRKIGLRASERAAHERAERAAAEAEARRIEGERRAAEARAAAERREMERRELQYFLSRQTNTMPNLVANDNAVAEGRGAQAVSAYRILWKLAKGQNLTDDEKNTLGEEYGLPIEALTHPESFSDADMARLQDGITRLWTDAANANIVVPPVYVATEADQHRVLPNEVYDPVFQLFRNGEVVVDASRAVPFTPQFAPGAAPDASEETDEETPATTATSVPTGSQAAPTAAPAAQRAPVGGHDVAPAPREDVFEFHRGGTLVRLVGGLWNWMHKPFNYKNESPTASRQDADGHGLWNGRRIPEAVSAALAAWKDHCPKYMGNKNEMLKRVVQAICNNFTTAEREGYTHLNDCFGGGGCWGLSIAMTALPNVKHIIVNEFDEGRIEKIRVLHTLDGQMEAKLRAFLGTRNVVPGIEARMRAQVSERTGNTLSPNGFNTRRWCYEALEAEIAHLSSEDKGILWAFLDNLQSQMQWAKRDASGANSLAAIIEFTIKSVSKDAVKATELAEAFKARGGEITYSAGDAKQQADFGTKKDTDGVYRRGASGEPLSVPHGGNVMSVTDPPYYLTEGYGESGTRSRVGLEADPMGWGYGDTQQMLGTLVDLRDGIVYTDEAWWFKPEYRFDETRTPREEQILGSIISDFDHFDVAGGVAGRQETLGVQHGRTQETVADGENAGNDVNAAGLPDGSGVRDVLQPAVPAVAAAAEGQDASTPRADDRSGGQRFWDGNPDTLVDAVTSGATIPRRLRGYANRLLGEAAGAQLRAAGITRFSISPRSGYGIISTDDHRHYLSSSTTLGAEALRGVSLAAEDPYASTEYPRLVADVLSRHTEVQGANGSLESARRLAQTSVRSLPDLFAALNSDEETGDLFRRVYPLAEKLGLTFGLEQSGEPGAGILGCYDDLGHITFFTDTLFGLPKQRFADTIVHEMIHGVSAYAIDRVSGKLNAPKAMLNETQRKAAEDIIALYDRIKGDLSGYYGGTNAHELLAELANPEFRAVLRQRGVWQAFVDAVKRLFGIEPQTDLDKAVDILDRFLAGVDADAAQAQYRDANRSLLDMSRFVTNYKYSVERARKAEAFRQAQAASDLMRVTRFSINPRYNDTAKYTDAQIESIATDGDLEAIAEWFSRNWRSCVKKAQRSGRSITADEAEEIVCEIRALAIEKFATDATRPDYNIGAFVHGAIRNLALTTGNRQAGGVGTREALTLNASIVNNDGDETENIERVANPNDTPVGEVSAKEQARRRVEEFLSHFNAEKRDIFEAVMLDGRGVKEVADAHDMALSAATSLIDDMKAEFLSGEYLDHTAENDKPIRRVPAHIQRVFDYFTAHPEASSMEAAEALGMVVENAKRKDHLITQYVNSGVKDWGLVNPRTRRPGGARPSGVAWTPPERTLAIAELAKQGLNADEIAEKLGITRAIVWSCVAKAKDHDMVIEVKKRPAGRWNKPDADASTPKAADILGSAAQTDEVRVHTRFSIMGNRAREEAYEAIAKFRPGLHGFVKMVDGVLTPQDDAAVNAIAAFDTPKERKVALFWFCRRAIELPDDRSLVTEAVKTAEKAHVDPFVFDHPGDILEKFAQYRPVEKPIDPATVPELSDRKEHGHGIVSFLVEDTKAGQAAMRRIVNTHLGKDKSPWCLLRADKNGELESDAWHYWMTYSALPKRAAFKDGRLCAFMATDSEFVLGESEKPVEEWWDRFDKSHDNIPFSVKDAEGRTLSQELLPDGSVSTYSVTRGDANAKDGVYEEWLDDGAYLKQTRENGFTVSREQFNRNGQMWDWYRSAHNGHCEVEIDRDVENQVSTAYANDTRADTEFWIRRAGKDRWHAYMLQRGANKLMFWTSDADRVVEAFKDIYAAMDSGDYTRAEALFAVEKAAADSAEAQKNAVTRFSITPRNPQTAAKYYLARDIMENGGRLPDSRYVAHVARSFGLAGNPSELINAAMAEAATQTRVLRYIASDPEIERLVANAGKSVRYENMIKRAREVQLKWSQDVSEAQAHATRSLDRAVRAVRGEDYERMVTREGIDLDAILRAIRPAEKAPVAHDGSTPDASPDGSATPTPATEAQGKALAERVIERAKELVEAAKEAVRTRSETASTAPTAENATEAGEEPAGRAGADETADYADAEASAVAAAYRRAIAESGITLDNPAEVVQLVKAVTEKYIRDNPGEVSDLDPADVWASPIARAMFAGNLASFAQSVAAAYSPSHARIRVAKKAQMLNDRGVNTLGAIERVGEEVFRDLNKDIIRQSRASLIGDIRKIAKGAGAHFTERVEAKDRKVSADTARYCSFVTWALNVPAAKVEETMLELEAFLNGYGGDLSEADKNRYKDYAEAQLKRQLLDLYGNLRARMPAELTEIRDRLAQMVDEGRFDSMCFSEQWEDARNAAVEAAVPGIVANPADKGVQPEPSWWRDWAYSLVGMWETKWRQLTRFCKDDAARTRSLEAMARVEELIQSAEDTQFNYMQEQKRKLRDLLGSVYGGEAEAREAISAEIDPALWHTLDRGDQHTQWTVGRLLQMYVSCVQPDYADNCAKYGRDAAYVAHLEGVIRSLDPRHFALITGLRSLYLEQGDALSAVMERTSGTRLYTPNRVYMPVDPLRTHDIGKKGEGRGYSPFAASLTPRVKHGLDFDQRTDILELFVDRAEDAAHTIGWAENGSMVLGICQSDRVLNAIRTAFGSKAMGQWNNYVLDILAGKNETSSGDEAKFMGVLARYASRLWIGLNPVSWTKQIMSFPCFALSLDGTLKDVVCSGAFWTLHPFEAFRCAKDLADTRAFQARYGIAISQELKYATSTEGAFKTWWAKYIDAIMKGVYSFDKLTVMMQAGIYRRRRAQLEKNGMPAHEASETAASWLMHIVDKTAQTARTLNTTQLQRAGGAWAFFLQFKSAPAQQSQFEVVAAQEAMANPRDAKRWKKLAEVIAINHIIVPAMNTAIESLFAAAVQGGMPDEEKRKRQLATLLANMLSGSLGSIVFIGLVVEGLASALMDLCVLDRKPSAYNFGRSQIPAFSVIGNAFGSYNQFAKALEEMDYNGVTHTAIEMATAIGGVIPGLSWPSRTAEKAHKAMEE